jgi:hypothetical protein
VNYNELGSFERVLMSLELTESFVILLEEATFYFMSARKLTHNNFMDWTQNAKVAHSIEKGPYALNE